MKLGTRIAASVSAVALALTGGAITAAAAQATVAEPDPGSPPDDGKCYDWVPPTTKVEDEIKRWVIDEPAVDEQTLYEWSVESPGEGWSKTGETDVLVAESFDWFVLGAGYDKDTPPLLDDPNWVDPQGQPNGQPHQAGKANPNVPYQVDRPNSQGKDWFVWKYTAPVITYQWVKVIPGTSEVGHWEYQWIADNELTPPGWERTGESRTVEDEPGYWKEKPCTPPPPPPPPVKCENLLGPEGALPFIPEGIDVQLRGNGVDCYYEVYVCWEIANPYDDFPAGTELFPQYYLSHSATRPTQITDCTPMVPQCEEVLQIQWDFYRIDSWDDAVLLDTLITNGLGHGNYQDGKPDDASILRNWVYGTFELAGDECPPPPPPPPAPEKVSLCEVVDGVATEVVYTEGTEPEDGIAWVNGDECAPNLAGTFIGNLCQGDVPYFTYDIVVNDPSGSVDPSALPTLTWVNPSGPDHVINLTDFSGQMLWPGGSASPLGWPGWEFNSSTGEYEDVGDGNFGWTRDGVQVIISVNPETTVTAEYPAATADCYGPEDEEEDEDEEFEAVLSAGPAIPVRGVATYAG